MFEQQRASTAPLISNGDEIKLTALDRTTDYRSIESPSSLQPNSKPSRSNKFMKNFGYLSPEYRGIERVLPDERTDSSVFQISVFWFSVNLTVPCFTIGTLGPAVFNLTLLQSFVTIFIFTGISTLLVAAISCFGPPSGLRTMVFSRYSWGYYGASIISLLSIIIGLGWSAVTAITSAQVLRVVFDDQISLTVGIILIAVIVLIISFVGYEWIHTYEKYAWIPIFAAFCIVALLSIKDIRYSQETFDVGRTAKNSWNIGPILGFGATCVASVVTWCVIAADFNTYLPENTSQIKIFLCTFVGTFLGGIPLQFLGAAVYIGTLTNVKWAHAYEIDNVGGLLAATLASLGIFSKLLLIIFALSANSSNIPNIYSFSLASQTISATLEQIPRMFYAVLGTIIYVVLAILATYNFNAALVAFLDVFSCFSLIFVVVVCEEHLIFRRCSYQNYDFNSWNNREVLPVSFAAMLAGIVGTIGFCLGMSQQWYEGPISKAMAQSSDERGPNIGFIGAFIFTAVTFPFFKSIELHFVNKFSL